MAAKQKPIIIKITGNPSQQDLSRCGTMLANENSRLTKKRGATAKQLEARKKFGEMAKARAKKKTSSKKSTKKTKRKIIIKKSK